MAVSFKVSSFERLMSQFKTAKNHSRCSGAQMKVLGHRCSVPQFLGSGAQMKTVKGALQRGSRPDGTGCPREPMY